MIKLNDKIKSTININSRWSGLLSKLISLTRNYSKYDTIWEINSKSNSDFYLAIKFKTNKIEYIGWLKLNLYKNNGRIHILDKEVSEMEELIRNR